MAAVETVGSLPWWKEPTKDQWYAYVAAWAGWTLDAFDFTAFLLIIAPIAKEFDVPVPEVVFVLTVTLWMRLVGATAVMPLFITHGCFTREYSLAGSGSGCV
jgi:hypothetical protein